MSFKILPRTIGSVFLLGLVAGVASAGFEAVDPSNESSEYQLKENVNSQITSVVGPARNAYWVECYDESEVSFAGLSLHHRRRSMVFAARVPPTAIFASSPPITISTRSIYSSSPESNTSPAISASNVIRIPATPSIRSSSRASAMSAGRSISISIRCSRACGCLH